MRWLGGPPKWDSRLEVGVERDTIRPVSGEELATPAYEPLELTHEESQSETKGLEGVLTGCIRQSLLEAVQRHRATPFARRRAVRSADLQCDTTPLTGRQKRVELSRSDGISHMPSLGGSA